MSVSYTGVNIWKLVESVVPKSYKQDALDEINAMDAEIQQLQSQLDEAVKGLGFFADEGNYKESTKGKTPAVLYHGLSMAEKLLAKLKGGGE